MTRLAKVAELRERAADWAVRLKAYPKSIRVRRMKRKWGSCSFHGTITLASDLAQQEGRVQDFVIVHELLHLRVQNHSKLFKTLMAAHIKGWRELDSHLRGQSRIQRAKR